MISTGFSGVPESARDIWLLPIDHCIFAYPIWHTDSLSNTQYLCQDTRGIAGEFAGLRFKFRCT